MLRGCQPLAPQGKSESGDEAMRQHVRAALRRPRAKFPSMLWAGPKFPSMLFNKREAEGRKEMLGKALTAFEHDINPKAQKGAGAGGAAQPLLRELGDLKMT